MVFLLSAAPRKGPEDSILGVICIGQDITYLKELEIKKGQIAAAITHELRSPLHGIIGLSDQLLSTDPNKGNRSLKLINNCARRLLDLVTNIMDLSTLVQSKHMVLARDPVQMAKLVEEVMVLTSMSVDKAGRPIRKKEVELINSVPSELPIIEADAHRCMQMLYNLVSNALKFTVKGKVEITAFPNDETEILTVIVEDTGIGIASQARDLIFRPFEQEDQSESRRYEGIGLGLSISKEVAVKHGGNLTVESELGKGSRFVVTLPYKPFFKEDTGDEEDDMIGVINGPSGMFMQEDKGPIAKDQPLPLEGGPSQKSDRHKLPAAPPQPKPEDRRPKAPPATPSVFNRKKPEAKRKVLVDTNETEIAEIAWRTPSGLEEQVHQKHSLDGYRLLSRMLPSGNAERILMGKDVVPEVCEDASVLVAALRGWDSVASMTSMEQAMAMLANLSQALETLSAPQGISIHKMFATEAECLVAISGLDADPGHEARLLHFTAALKERVEELQGELPATAPKLSLAVGIDAGVVCRTIFGSQRPILSVLGSAVIGARRLNLQAQKATGSAIFASVNVLRRLSVSSGPVQVAGMTAVSAGRAQQGSVEIPYFALLREGEELPVLEPQAPVRPAADPDPQPAVPPIPAPVEMAVPAVPEPVSPGTLGALLEGFPRTMNGDAEQELFQLRSIAIALQRQNAHLHLENTQLRRHLGSVGPMLGQLAGLRAVAQEQAQESELRSKRMELELQFWKFQTGLTVSPTLSGWAPEF